MTFRKKTKAKFKSFLRRLGLLCKQPLFEGNTFETELHIWKEVHKDVKKPRKNKKK